MLSSTLSNLGPATQMEKAKPDQVQNNAGGYVFAVDKWKRLGRFLILGSDGPTYYTSSRALTRENAGVVLECYKEDPLKTLQMIGDISNAGRAPKNDAAILALALGISGEMGTAGGVVETIPLVCRTGTHMLQLCASVNGLRGWGRSAKRAISSMYLRQDPTKLAYQLVKYRNREGFTHRDALRLAHVNTKDSPEHSLLFKWATAGTASESLPGIVHAYEAAKTADERELVFLIENEGLTHEMIPDTKKQLVPVWEALFKKMPLTATIRNLSKLTSLGIVAPLSDVSAEVVRRLTDAEYVRKSRVHPIQVLIASKAYSAGRGRHLAWQPVQNVVGALDDCFTLAFGNIEESEAKIFVGLDVSGSMSSPISGEPGAISAREASCAMSLIHARKNKQCHIMGFSHAPVQIGVTPKTTLREMLDVTARIPFGGTDCSLPMLVAKQSNVPVDTFVVYTDNETWAGNIHPFQALKQYRKSMGRDTRLAVCATSASGFRIADPSDAGMLDLVGFDSSTPQIIGQFSRGEI